MSRVWFNLQQRLLAVAFANRFTLLLAKLAIDLSSMMSRRRHSNSAINRSAVARDADPAEGRDPELAHWDRYQSEFGAIQGWFLEPAQALWDALLCFQKRDEVQGKLLEIGVWKGKSATCSTLHADDSELCVFVDRIFLREFRQAIKSIREERTLFLRGSSSDPKVRDRLLDMPKSFRWIHIDGDHSGVAVRRELMLARQLLNARGVIVVDDFFSSAYPQITLAVSQFLHDHPQFHLFLCDHNKAYLCRSARKQAYLEYVKRDLYADMKKRGVDQVTIWKSNRADDFNCFGMTDRIKQFDYRGPDDSPLTIDC